MSVSAVGGRDLHEAGVQSPGLRGASSGERVQLPVTVGKHEDAFHVGFGFLEIEPFEEAVHVSSPARPPLVPHALDAVRAAIVAGEREIDIAVEEPQHMAEVVGAEAHV